MFCVVTVNDVHTKPTIIHKIFETNFSGEIAHYEKSLVYAFQEFFGRIVKIFILRGSWTCHF